MGLPESIAELRSAGESFAAELREMKARVAVADYGWYPYQTLTALPTIAELLTPVWDEMRGVGVVADIGCGDGDLAALFARLGCEVDAIDHAESNFNQLRGVETLCSELALPLAAHDIDLDRPFTLPRTDYGLALFLGTLYHLKNPFYVLENLAAQADWCVLSTRIAQSTPGGRTGIEDEPVAYLLGAREANNDPTNFWIFSFTGLVRLMERAGWMVMGHKRVGCEAGSDPVNPDADERVFVVAKSRTRHPGLQVRALEGWHAPEGDGFRWTERRFGLEVTLPGPAREFALRFFVPDSAAASGPVRVTCSIAGTAAGAITVNEADSLEFRGWFPSQEISHRLQFTVESSFHPEGDLRDLGICVPLAAGRIPFRIS